MGKFLKAWEQYAKQVEQMDTTNQKQLKKQLQNEEFDQMFKDKFSDEQQETLKDFRNIIYESEKRKAEQNK